MKQQKCSPVEMRKNLEAVEIYKQYGIDFVAVPVGGEFSKKKLIMIAMQQLEDLENE
ncbi:hypothetical protein PP411_gp25 [Vibrio phage vB_VpP_BT-1011]|uniref:Uncharacterized protein n=1 Tax=Vibrio phage vB_VpP_BT-1011 TaxID=2799672 RepID=A0A8F2XXH3_9CAUD|nr:hypothetical protein PP411_gp25 [Vibrio phage vB_VpP_BT-1011]QWX10224.1 hypothetical protein vBVpPBT1011_0025 [Vibrio phage vB_VpP_BT-1011]